MKLKIWLMVRHAILKEAMRQRRSTAELKAQMRRTIYIGVHSSEPKIHDAWKAVNDSGEIPTPEEAVAYWATRRMSVRSQDK